MQSSGFANAPLTKYLLFCLVAASVVVTATDTKHYFHIHPPTHLLRYAQYWRLVTQQLCYLNSTEVLFAGVTLYQLRAIERLWGTRKFASFFMTLLPYTTLLPPLAATLLSPLAPTALYLPAGPTALVFALLAQYHAAIPYTYRYKVATSSAAGDDDGEARGVLLTSKSASYLMPLQLAAAQLPGSALSAAIGWVLGYAWRSEILPGATWRVPRWVFGEKAATNEAEGLRRRMREDVRRA